MKASPLAVTGPLPVTAESQPFRGLGVEPIPGDGLAPPSLEPFGYIEEEDLVSGDVDEGAFTTTVLVRRPADVNCFSGLVVSEPVHVMGGVPMWLFRDYLMSRGRGYAQVVSQRVVADSFVKTSNPGRYAQVRIRPEETPTEHNSSP